MNETQLETGICGGGRKLLNDCTSCIVSTNAVTKLIQNMYISISLMEENWQKIYKIITKAVFDI